MSCANNILNEFNAPTCNFNNGYNNSNTNDIFNQICTGSASQSNLTSLYKTDPLLFEKAFIDTIITFAQLKEYNVFALQTLPNLLFSNTFRQIASTKDPVVLQSFSDLLDPYFKAIGKYKNVSYQEIKNKILKILVISITIPTMQTMSISQAKISISTAFKPRQTALLTTKMDIENIMNDMYCSAIMNSTPKEVIFNPYPNNVQLQGAILPNIISSTLIVLEEMQKESMSLGIQTKTNLTSKSLVRR